MSNSKRAQAQSQEAVETIFAAHPSAQFVVMKPAPAKSPAWRAWNRKQPSLGAVCDAIGNGNGIAIVPATVACAVIDVDAGDPAVLEQARPPLCMLATRRGAHAYYAAGEKPPRNMNGRIITVAGEELKVDVVVGATPQTRKYVVIHTAAAMTMLATALSSGEPPGRYPFPHDLLELSPAAARYNESPVRIQAHLNTPRRIDLTRIYPGARNENLFAVCCRWSQAAVAMHRAGKLKTPDDLLHAAVLWNNEFPIPLPLAEVEGVARKAWNYLTLSSGGEGLPFYTHDTESQRRRQSLAVAARNTKRKPEVEAVFALAARGKFPVEIHRKTGVPLTTVKRWLKSPL